MRNLHGAWLYDPRPATLDPSEWTWGRPSPQMADEAEALITQEDGDRFESPECAGAKSLDGTGEFNFECTAEDRESGERRELDVLVFGSESGKPEPGEIGIYLLPAESP